MSQSGVNSDAFCTTRAMTWLVKLLSAGYVVNKPVVSMTTAYFPKERWILNDVFAYQNLETLAMRKVLTIRESESLLKVTYTVTSQIDHTL